MAAKVVKAVGRVLFRPEQMLMLYLLFWCLCVCVCGWGGGGISCLHSEMSGVLHLSTDSYTSCTCISKRKMTTTIVCQVKCSQNRIFTGLHRVASEATIFSEAKVYNKVTIPTKFLALQHQLPHSTPFPTPPHPKIINHQLEALARTKSASRVIVIISL